MSVFGQIIGTEMRPDRRQSRVARVSEDGNERISMHPDTSMNAVAARHNATLIYGRQNLSPEFAMRAVIEVKDPDGNFVPVTGSRQGVPSMEVQQAALASFRETGIIGPQPINRDGSAAEIGTPVISTSSSNGTNGQDNLAYEGVIDGTLGSTPNGPGGELGLSPQDNGFARPTLINAPIIQRTPIGGATDSGGLMPQTQSEAANLITMDSRDIVSAPAPVVDSGGQRGGPMQPTLIAPTNTATDIVKPRAANIFEGANSPHADAAIDRRTPRLGPNGNASGIFNGVASNARIQTF